MKSYPLNLQLGPTDTFYLTTAQKGCSSSSDKPELIYCTTPLAAEVCILAGRALDATAGWNLSCTILRPQPTTFPFLATMETVQALPLARLYRIIKLFSANLASRTRARNPASRAVDGTGLDDSCQQHHHHLSLGLAHIRRFRKRIRFEDAVIF